MRYPCPLFSADDLNRDIFVSSSLQRIQERRSSQFLPGLNSASWSLPFCPTRRSKPRDWFNEFLKCQRIPRILKLVTFHVWLSHKITWKLFGCTRPINCLIGSALIWKSDGLRPCTATIHCSLNLMIYLYLPRKKKSWSLRCSKATMESLHIVELKQTEHSKQLEDNQCCDDCCRAVRLHGRDGKHNRLGHETHTPESRLLSDPPSFT